MGNGFLKNSQALKKMVILVLGSDGDFALEIKSIFDRYSKKSVISKLEGDFIFDESEEPDIIILSTKLSVSEIQKVEAINRRYKNSEIVALGNPPSQEVLLKLLELGIKGYFKDELNLSDFESYINEIATTHEQHKRILELNLRVYDLLDIIGSMIILTDGNEIKYANKSFLRFVSIETQEDFAERFGYVFDLNAIVVKINESIIKDGDNWIELLKNSTQKFSVAYLHDIHENTSTAFITSIAELPCYQNNYVIAFTDVTKIEEDKMLLKKELDTSIELRFLIEEEIEQLRKKEQFILQQSRMISMGEMLNNIIHQWKQPLTSISLMLNNLNDAREFGDINDSIIENTIKKCLIQVDYMSATINDFKTFLSPSKKKSIFSLKDAIEQTISLISSHYLNKLIQIEFVLLTNEKTNVYGYSNEFKQVILNILNNAKDAIIDRLERERHSFTGMIKIELDRVGNNGIISITDNGGGIKDEHQAHIFEQYFTTKDEYGTGIGLYMSKIIIETNMEGKIEVKNHGDGARFKIFIPLDTPKHGI